MKLMTKVDFIRMLINMQVKADTNGLRNLQLNKQFHGHHLDQMVYEMSAACRREFLALSAT